MVYLYVQYRFYYLKPLADATNATKGKSNRIPESSVNIPELTKDIPKSVIPATTAHETLPKNNGLPNIGNTCYFNSLMQAFLTLPVLQKKDLPIPFQQMHELIFEDQTKHKSVRAATMDAFTNLNVMLRNKLVLGQQEDCHEFISSFFGLKESEPLHPYLKIKSSQTLKCLNNNCNYISTTEHEALQILNEFRCEDGCGLYTRCSVSSCVTKTPPVLMLFTKLFDEFTNFKIIYDSEYKPIETFLKLPTTYTKNDPTYKLSSFITHSGRERTGGHYKAYVLNGSSWLCCDDSIVTVVSQPTLSENEHVYVQFYTRRN